ncbi:hypothetical protein ACHAAC_09755 [Aeromicrobium sp. CF4.19]|uniref:hypothetical protein n=1 Tax=Aeromicrobium sp. CF4.19 TaxID=3373082 RepID=UPI003EE587D4
MSAHQPGRRRLDTNVPADYDVPTRAPRLGSPDSARTAMVAVFVLWVLATIGAGTSLVAVDAPQWLVRPSAAMLLVVFSLGLTHRAGGHMRIWSVAATVLGIAAIATQASLLISAAAIGTAVLAATWAVVVTKPAETVPAVLREFFIAISVAGSGTIAVAAWNAPVNYQRFNLFVLAVALALAIAIVWNLGAGLHGLGRQNLTILLGVAGVLLLLLAYSSFVRTHGSQMLVEGLTDLVIWMRQTFRGVPRPVEVFIGFPALIVGISLRSQRREGWWVLVFAVLGTGVMTTSLVSPGAYPSYIALSTVYSIVLGVAVGLALRHVALRQRSRRSRAMVQERRVEPGRLAPLK